MELRATRKADRQKMAEMVRDAALANKAVSAEIRKAPIGDRELWIDIEAEGGAAVTVSIDGDWARRNNSYVLPWHMDFSSNRKMSYLFGALAGGSVNPYHKAKCTAVCWSFEDMLTSVGAVLLACADGTAYEQETADA
jgi:hypothetical protein